MKKVSKYFWVAYILAVVITILLCSCSTTYPKPRYNEEANFHKRLESQGYIQVTSCNLVSGEQKTVIKKL